MKEQEKIKFVWMTGLLCAVLLVGAAGMALRSNAARVEQRRQALRVEKERLEYRVSYLGNSIEALRSQERSEEENGDEADAEKKQHWKEREERAKQEKEALEQEAASGLEGVEETIAANTMDAVNAGERWSVSVQRLSDGASVNVGNERMEAASLIKLYIMGAVYEQYDSLAEQCGAEELDRLLSQMITVSDNDAANMLTGLLGGGDNAAGRAAVDTYCVSRGYVDSSMGRMLLESNENGDNYTSAADCQKFLGDVYHARLAHSEEMLALLKQQERTEKIPAGIPEGVETANKTGELPTVENDAAIVWADGEPYTLCILSGGLGDTAAARERIVRLSLAVYDKMR